MKNSLEIRMSVFANLTHTYQHSQLLLGQTESQFMID